MDRMTNSNIKTQMDLEGLPRHLTLTTAAPTYQMRVSDTIMIMTSSAGAGTGVITLPPMAEAVGMLFYIIAPTGAAGDNVSLFESETAALIVTGNVGPFDADGDYVLLYSTGTAWVILVDGVA